MATYVPAKRATAYRFTLSLFARSDNQIKITPTLAAGDVKVSKDNGATNNITTLPTETPASSGILQVDLSATEMTADLVTVVFRDAAGAEWNDVAVHIATAARQIDDLAYPATSGRSMVVDAAGLVDANMVKAGPTGSGSAITARDIGASVLLSAGTGTGQLDFTSGVVKANLAQILGTALTETAGQIAAAFKQFFDVASPTGTMKAITNVVTTTTATNVTTVNGLAAGVITSSSFTAGAIDAAAIAADAIGASELAASAVTEIQAGLSTLDAAGVRSAVGLASANLDTQIATLATSSTATAIKAKTDSLTFTVAGQVDANIQSVNDVTVTGTGAAGDEWGP